MVSSEGESTGARPNETNGLGCVRVQANFIRKGRMGSREYVSSAHSLIKFSISSHQLFSVLHPSSVPCFPRHSSVVCT